MKKRVWGTYFSSAASSRVRVFARFLHTVERHPRTPGRALPGQRDGDGYTMAVSSHDGIDHERKNLCVDEASAAGVKGAAFGIAVSAPVVAAAHFLSPMFRSFSVSTKTGLIVTPFFGFFFLNSELAMNACAQKRKAYAAAVRA